MPETSVDEYCQSEFRKVKVWLASNVRRMLDPTRDAFSAERIIDAPLCGFVASAANEAHSRRAFLRSERVSHLARTRLKQLEQRARDRCCKFARNGVADLARDM
jgi:hypothetical protein